MIAVAMGDVAVLKNDNMHSFWKLTIVSKGGKVSD